MSQRSYYIDKQISALFAYDGCFVLEANKPWGMIKKQTVILIRTDRKTGIVS